MALKKTLIALEYSGPYQSSSRKFIGIASNCLEAIKMIHAYLWIFEQEDPDLYISKGVNEGRSANYHRFLQSMRSENKAELSSDDDQHQIRAYEIQTNELIPEEISIKIKQKQSKKKSNGRATKSKRK